jgi:hypothetical protein
MMEEQSNSAVKLANIVLPLHQKKKLNKIPMDFYLDCSPLALHFQKEKSSLLKA